jgi:hypothetical protein
MAEYMQEKLLFFPAGFTIEWRDYSVGNSARQHKTGWREPRAIRFPLWYQSFSGCS